MALSLPARHEPIPRCVDRERQLEAQPVGCATRHANEAGVHSPQMVECGDRAGSAWRCSPESRNASRRAQRPGTCVAPSPHRHPTPPWRGRASPRAPLRGSANAPASIPIASARCTAPRETVGSRPARAGSPPGTSPAVHYSAHRLASTPPARRATPRAEPAQRAALPWSEPARPGAAPASGKPPNPTWNVLMHLG